MRRCVIVGAGELYSPIEVREGDCVIAADGGINHLLNANIKADILIGDFDSIDEIPELAGVEIIRHPVEKDETDMYLAYRLGVEKGYDDFVIYGGTGGREDHTFANYCLLLCAKNENNRVVLISDNRKIFVIKNEKAELTSSSGKGISLFAFGADADGVSIEGLKYEAKNITLSAAYPLGVSNSFTDNGRALVSVKNGALLVVQEI